MSILEQLVQSVVDGVMREIGTRKRVRRRKRALTSAERLRRIEKLLRPASQQTSRKKTTRTRSTAHQKRIRTRTQKHTKSLRIGKARR